MTIAANNVIAAAFSLVVSAALFSYAILPGSPQLLA